MGTALYNMEDINKRFHDNDKADKRMILSALGSNPILLDGQLCINEHFWLINIANERDGLTDLYNNV